MKKLKLVALVAGLSACGFVSVAQAGQIQASATAYAREAIRTDALNVAMPVVGYKLNGSIDARSQVQQFSLKVSLNGGAVFATAPPVGAIYLRDQSNSNNLVTPQSAVLSASGDQLIITFNIPVLNGVAPALGFYPNPIVIINETSGVATASTYGGVAGSGGVSTGTIKNLFTGLAEFTAECPTDAKFVSATVRHFDSAGQEDDSLRSGNANTANVIALNTTHYIDIQKNTKAGTTTAISGNTVFLAGNGGGAVAGVAGTGANNGTEVTLGRFDVTTAGGGTTVRDIPAAFTTIQPGFDRDGNNFYTIEQGVAIGGVAPNKGGYAPGLPGSIEGGYEAKNVNVTVNAPGGFAVGSKVYLSPAANCAVAGALGSVTTTAGMTSAALTIPAPAAPWSNAGVNGAAVDGVTYAGGATGPRLYICYKVPGTVTVPATDFTAKVTIEKVATDEQNNVCSGSLYSLGGALKIDVRNYMPAAVTAASGWLSVIRLINTSDTFNAVKVYGQTIHSDGKLGNSVLLTTMKARQAIYMTNAEIDAKLLAGTAPDAGAANNGAAVGAVTSTGALADNTRLRITAEGGNTLRVQNYLFNTRTEQLVEASGSQGVDFAGSAERAPAGEGQYQDQDAQSGINLK